MIKDNDISSHTIKQCENPNCEICGSKKPFVIPKEIVDAVIDKRLIIFAGAGVSTEGRRVFKISLYEDVKRELAIQT